MKSTDANDASPLGSERLYHPEADERQFTWRAVLVGCLVGSVVSCTNIYIGLKIGWTFGASIISAVLGFAVFRAVGAQLTVLETNITQTAGSAAGSMASAAGLVAAIPAMQLLGYEMQWHQLIFWALTVAFLGVFFAVPLRRQVVVIDKLRFPTGTATAETILAMFSDAGEAVKKAKVLIYGGVCAGVFTLLTHFIPPIESPEATWVLPYLAGWSALGALALYLSGRTRLAGLVAAAGAALFGLHFVIPAAIFSTAAVWTFKMYFGPSLFGAGFLIGPRVCLSLLLGALIAWA
ncbi:MAG: hypothetical protein CMH53_03255, partial [Myxococcales bacterium]|nr:hypothetical protein [Myxococcales bacterium]